MDMTRIPVFAAIRAKMEWLSQRQNLLAENIANADTPGYRARDLKPLDFQGLIEKQRMTAGLTLTNAGHIGGGSDKQRFDFDVHDADALEVNSAGNAVSIEEEMMKLGQTQMEYEAAAGIYRKQSGLLKMALGSRR